MPFAATRVTESLPPVTDLLKDYKARALKLPAKPVAVAAAWLASDLGRNVTGQLIGVRGRDVFLMSQPRPIAHAIAKGTGWMNRLWLTPRKVCSTTIMWICNPT